MSAASEYNCRKCGVCCVLMTVVLTEDDVDRIFVGCGPLAAMTRIRPLAGGRYRHPALYEMVQEQRACWAFHGHVGKRCSCSIYKFRPAACRTFVPGAKKCREVLQLAQRHGLITPTARMFP